MTDEASVERFPQLLCQYAVRYVCHTYEALRRHIHQRTQIVDEYVTVAVSSPVESERPVFETEKLPAEVDSSSGVYNPFGTVNPASLVLVGKAQYVRFFLLGHPLGRFEYPRGLVVRKMSGDVPVQFYIVHIISRF